MSERKCVHGYSFYRGMDLYGLGLSTSMRLGPICLTQELAKVLIFSEYGSTMGITSQQTHHQNLLMIRGMAGNHLCSRSKFKICSVIGSSTW